MIKGIMALFKSGVIFNPMVLSGVVIGLLMAVKLQYEQVVDIYKNYHFYLLAVFLAASYNLCFKRVYKGRGDTLDAKAIVLNTIGSAVKFIFSSVMAVAFVLVIALD